MDVHATAMEALLRRVQDADSALRRAYVRETAAQLGVSERTVYRRLKAMGWSSGRKPRADRREGSALTREACARVASVVATGRNKRGQANVPVTEAIEILKGQGELPEGISYSQVCRRLRQEGLGPRHMGAPEASIARVSQHPNHVWFIDVSPAIQWYFRGEDGRKLGQYTDAGARFYVGKLDNVRQLRRIIHRYTVVDHYSGAFVVQYFYSPGERAEDVVSALWGAMSAKSLLGWSFPFRGVPRRLVTDRGSAFRSGLVTELLEGLGVEHELHAPQNPKASGAVEKTHDLWQRSFEGRLALHPAEDLAQLNAWALKWSAVANTERIHGRHGRTRLDMWSTITTDQLIEAPTRQTFYALAATRPQEGVLDNYLRLRRDNNFWQVRGENVHPGQRVRFRFTPFAEPGVRVWDEHGRELAATELRFDEAGFALNGLRHVWDDDSAPGATAPATPAQRVAVAAAEEPVRIDDVFADLDARLQRVTYLETQGQPWTPGAEPAETAAEPPMGALECLEEVAHRLGRPLGEDAAWWRGRIGDGLTLTALEAAWLDFIHLDLGVGDAVNLA